MTDNPMDDAREFFKYSKMTDNLDDVMNSPAPIKVGCDLEGEEVILSVHDKMYFMDETLAEATIYAIWLALRTIEAKRATQEN